MGQTSSKSPAELTELLTKNDWAKRSGFADPEKIFPRILCQSVYESESVTAFPSIP